MTGVLVSRPDSLCQSYALATEVGGAAFFAANQTEQFSPSALLAISIGPFDTSMTLETLIDVQHAPLPCAALIVDGASSEIVNVTAFNGTTLVATIARGCVDTVSGGPAGFGHAAGLEVFFIDNYVGSDGEQYTATEVVHNKPLPNAPSRSAQHCACAGYSGHDHRSRVASVSASAAENQWHAL